VSKKVIKAITSGSNQEKKSPVHIAVKNLEIVRKNFLKKVNFSLLI